MGWNAAPLLRLGAACAPPTAGSDRQLHAEEVRHLDSAAGIPTQSELNWEPNMAVMDCNDVDASGQAGAPGACQCI